MIRALVKGVANGLAIVLCAPLAGAYHLLALAAPARREALFQGFTQFMSLGPGHPGDYLRRAFLWMTCRRCAMDSSIGFGTIFASPDVVIEAGVYVGPYCVIGHATIGRDTMLGTGVHLIGGGHAHGVDRLDQPMRMQERQVEVIRIGEDCWLGNGSIVLVDVGAHAIVGAGAVVTRPVAEWMVVAGNPARVLRDRRGAGDQDRGVAAAP